MQPKNLLFDNITKIAVTDVTYPDKEISTPCKVKARLELNQEGLQELTKRSPEFTQLLAEKGYSGLSEFQSTGKQIVITAHMLDVNGDFSDISFHVREESSKIYPVLINREEQSQLFDILRREGETENVRRNFIHQIYDKFIQSEFLNQTETSFEQFVHDFRSIGYVEAERDFELYEHRNQIKIYNDGTIAIWVVENDQSTGVYGEFGEKINIDGLMDYIDAKIHKIETVSGNPDSQKYLYLETVHGKEILLENGERFQVRNAEKAVTVFEDVRNILSAMIDFETDITDLYDWKNIMEAYDKALETICDSEEDSSSDIVSKVLHTFYDNGNMSAVSLEEIEQAYEVVKSNFRLSTEMKKLPKKEQKVDITDN